MLSDDDVREVLRIIDTTPLAELRIETNGFFLHVTRETARSGGGANRARTVPPAVTTPAEPASPSLATTTPEDARLTIQAPMLGTFYRAQAPGEPPFVDIGSRVEPDTTVCIIEVMKMMNSIVAGVAGTVAEICVTDAELVEYGAPLFRVEPL